jgi:multiple RNA-binding domain-containing protein 1
MDEIVSFLIVEHVMVSVVGEEDQELAEFLSLMQPRHKKAIWSNEDAFVQEQKGLTVKNKQSLDVVDDGSASDEEYEDVEKATEDVPRPAPHNDVDGVVVDAGVSDLDYLKSRMTSKFSDDEEESGGSDEEPASGAPSARKQDEDATTEDGQKSLPHPLHAHCSPKPMITNPVTVKSSRLLIDD